MDRKLAQFRQCLAFFTRLPIVVTGRLENVPRLADVAWCLPLVGMLIGALAVLPLYMVMLLNQSSLLAAIVALAFQCFITGALHEDGLADCSDALGGGYDQAARLAILKDSRIGVFGAVSLMFVLLIKIASLVSLVERDLISAILALVFVAMVSRFVMMVLAVGQRIPDDGNPLASAAGRMNVSQLLLPLLWVVLFVWFMVFGSEYLSWFDGVLVLIILSSLAVFLRHWLQTKFGRITGDGFGFAQQLAETAGLLLLALFV